MGNITGNYNAGVLSLASSGATATLAQWQNALRAVTYNNTSQNPGASRTVRLTVNDGNYTSQDADKSISIAAVNTAPVIITPAGIGVAESTETPLTGISFADADSGAANVTAVFTVSAGAFSGVNAGSVYVSGSGTAALTLTGPVSDINDFINTGSLKYTPVTGSLDDVQMAVRIDDGGNTGSGGAKTALVTVVISISAVNDPPAVVASPTIAVVENTASALSGITFSDTDAGSGSVDVILTVSSGALTAVSGNGVTVAGSGTTIVTLSGTVANINTLISNGVLKFTTALNNKNNVALGITIDDKGNTGSGGAKNASATVTLQVAGSNHAPTISITSPFTVTEDVSASLTGVSFADDDAGNAAVETVFSVTSGAFIATAGGVVAVDNSTTGSIKLTGSITDINIYIQAGNVSYTPAADNTSAVTLSLSINDKGNTGAGGDRTASTTAAISVTPVNDPPAIAASLGKTGYIIGKGSVAVDNSLTVSDVDNLTLAAANVSIGSGFQSSEDVLSFTNNGSMGNIMGSYDPAQGALMLTSAGSTATLAQWQAALRSVRYNNTSATPDTNERTMQITANDGVDDSSGTNKYVTISQPVYYDISGTVKGSDTNQGLAASLQLKDNLGGNVGTAVVAAADGSYTITGVLAGTGYTIAVSMPGYTDGSITSFDVTNANISGKDITLQKIAVPPTKILIGITVVPPSKTIYKIGESLNTAGMVVTSIYSDGSRINVSGYSLSGFSSTTIGSKTVTVSYGGKTATFTVTVTEKSLQGISVVAPSKTVYQLGEAFNSAGLKVTAKYDDGTKEEVTDRAILSGFDNTTPGAKTITVSYNGKTATFAVQVQGKALASITLVPPSKLTYAIGESLDKTGMKVTAVYIDQSTEDVTALTAITGFDSNAAGSKIVTVSYSGKNTVFTVIIDNKRIKSISVVPPSKTEYNTGDELDLAGMKVIAKYSDNSKSDVTAQASVSGYSRIEADRQKIIVSYGGKKDTFWVTVNGKDVKSVTVTTLPSKMTYNIGEAFDPSGMTVTATYKDGTTADVASMVTISGYSSRNAGKETVTVKYQGKRDSFQVEIVEALVVNLQINAENVALEKRDTFQLKVQATDTVGKTKTVTTKADYASSDKNTASVNRNGKVTGRKTGNAVITVTYGGISKTVNVIVQ